MTAANMNACISFVRLAGRNNNTNLLNPPECFFFSAYLLNEHVNSFSFSLLYVSLRWLFYLIGPWQSILFALFPAPMMKFSYCISTLLMLKFNLLSGNPFLFPFLCFFVVVVVFFFFSFLSQTLRSCNKWKSILCLNVCQYFPTC